MTDVSYEDGEPAEKLVESYLLRKGYWITPARTQRVSLNGAPMLEGQNASLIQPDIFALGKGRFFWAEVKQKTTAHFVRKRQQQEHGIEKRQLRHYRQVMKASGQPVLLFVAEEDTGALLCLNLRENTPYQPLNPKASQSSTGSVMLNFARSDFSVLRDIPSGVNTTLSSIATERGP